MSDDLKNYPYLEVIAGPQEGQTIPLKNGEYNLGRGKEQTIPLNDSSVSRAHARLIVTGNKVQVLDLASRNGTFLWDKKLREMDPTNLKHLDQIRVGIYLFRFVEKPVTEEDLAKAGPPPPPSEAPASFVADSSQVKENEDKKVGENLRAGPMVSDMESSKSDIQKELAASNQMRALVPFDKEPEDSAIGLKLKYLFYGMCGFVALTGLIYFLSSRLDKNAEKPVVGAEAPVSDLSTTDVPTPTPEPSAVLAPTPSPMPGVEETKGTDLAPKPAELPSPEVPPTNLPVAAVVTPPISETRAPIPEVKNISSYQTFLDVTSLPTIARISFENQDLGQTPLKRSVSVVPDQEYTVVAQFDLRDVRDQYQQKMTFKADPRKEVIPLVFDAAIATVKVKDLPRDVDFSFEGYYAYDTEKSHLVKINNIIYGKPFYVPYGTYRLELRQKTYVPGSKTPVDEIRYQRDLVLNESNRNVELAINDRQLQFFPAKINSDPKGAQIMLDGTRYGLTPFNGELPLGKHTLTLSKDGYFDTVQELDMRTNTFYEGIFTLKTSKVGEYINNARSLKTSGETQEAIDTLVEALKLEATPREKAEAHLLVADCFSLQKNYEQALSYYNLAKIEHEFSQAATLGLAQTYFAMGNRDKSLTLLIEVFLNSSATDPTKNAAQALFTKLSPIKSVIYIQSTPPGATVFLNGQESSQVTPLILSDLSLGTYRIEIRKEGYVTQNLKKNLPLSEFSPILVTLKAIP